MRSACSRDSWRHCVHRYLDLGFGDAVRLDREFGRVDYLTQLVKLSLLFEELYVDFIPGLACLYCMSDTAGGQLLRHPSGWWHCGPVQLLLLAIRVISRVQILMYHDTFHNLADDVGTNIYSGADEGG